MNLKIKFTILLILKINLSVQQDQVCTLPDDNRQSTCIRLHLCDSFQNLIRQHNGRPPQSEIQNINAHICASGGYVCCPFNNTTVESQISTENAMNNRNKNYEPIKANLTELRNHQNFNLINANSCGPYIKLNKLEVMGGVNERFESPWTVLLGYRSLQDDPINWDCGASLITERFILTAAHCVNSNLKLARLNEHTISTDLDCYEDYCADPIQDILIEKKIKHPKYNRITKVNDIALLKLATEADTTKNNVKTICLPTDEQDSFDVIKNKNKHFNIYGWGTIGDGNKNSDVLQKLYVPHFDHQYCVDEYAPYLIKIHETHICAGGYTNMDACAGDSGGGLVTTLFYKSPLRVILYGVILGGVKCDYESSIALPGLYTNIDYYLHWILDNLSQ